MGSMDTTFYWTTALCFSAKNFCHFQEHKFQHPSFLHNLECLPSLFSMNEVNSPVISEKIQFCHKLFWTPFYLEVAVNSFSYLCIRMSMSEDFLYVSWTKHLLVADNTINIFLCRKNVHTALDSCSNSPPVLQE